MPKMEAGIGAIGTPFAGDLLDGQEEFLLVGAVQLVQAGYRFLQDEVVDGENIFAADGVHEEDTGGPGANTFDGSDQGEGVRVVEAF